MDMNIEEIMKPYFEKKQQMENRIESLKEELEKIRTKRQKNVRINSLKLQLERIRNNKESEIAEYIQNALLEGNDFYSGYSAMIRADLEREYALKERELEKEIEELSKNTFDEIEEDIEQIPDEEREIELENEIKALEKYYRVDIKELIEIKSEIRKSLISAKKELEFNIMEAKINFDVAMLKLKRFEYIYDENNRILNSNEFKELYDEVNRLIEIKYGYEMQLKQLNEYLKMTELEPEEIKIGMMSLTPWEKEEYDRRKASKIKAESIAQEIKESGASAEDIKNDETNELDKHEENIPFDLTESLKKEVEEQKEQIEEEIFGNEEKSEEFSGNEEKEEDVHFTVLEPDELPIEEEKTDEEEVEFKEIEENLTKEIEKELSTPEEKIKNDLNDSTLDIQDVNIKFDENDDVIADTYNDLLKFIFIDVIDEAKKMRSIKIDSSKGELSDSSRYISTNEEGRYEPYEVKGTVNSEEVELPTGEFVNKKDIFKAIDNYRKSNKGRTFTVNGVEHKVTRKTAKNLKKLLKHCTTVTLLNEKKITEFDMKRVIIKNHTDDNSKLDLGRVETSLQAGDYISAEQFLGSLRTLFEEKKESWFSKTFEKIRNRKSKKVEENNVIDYVENNEMVSEEENVKTR